jgi:hypothetical protein
MGGAAVLQKYGRVGTMRMHMPLTGQIRRVISEAAGAAGYQDHTAPEEGFSLFSPAS